MQDILHGIIDHVVAGIDNDFGNRSGNVRFSESRFTDKQKILRLFVPEIRVEILRIGLRFGKNPRHTFA